MKPTRTSRCNEQLSYTRFAFAKRKVKVPAHYLKVVSKVLIFIETLRKTRASGPREYEKESRAAVPAWVKVGCHLPDKVKSVYGADYRNKRITFLVMLMD